jgi:hypothetical protein
MIMMKTPKTVGRARGSLLDVDAFFSLNDMGAIITELEA